MKIVVLGLLLVCVPVFAEEGVDDRGAIRERLAEIHSGMQPLSEAMNLSHRLLEPSLVCIHTSREQYITGRRHYITREQQVGEGSGFVFASDEVASWILTNAHVVHQIDPSGRFVSDGRNLVPYGKVSVRLQNNEEHQARIIGADRNSDLCVLRIDVPGLPTVEWGDSDQVQVGDWVLALGFPLGIDYTASAGIVSAINRSTGIYNSQSRYHFGFEAFIQTDAAINPGNSGGPLVDLRGQVIGINASIYSKDGGYQGIGFAIPSKLASRVAEDLRSYGRFKRPTVGIRMRELQQEDVDRLGYGHPRSTQIYLVIPGTPADTAGLRPGDIIISIDGNTVADPQHVRTLIASGRIDEVLPMRIWRRGEELDIAIRPIDEEAMIEVLNQIPLRNQAKIRDYGMSVRVDRFSGLLIHAVEPGGPADRAGLRAGDRITWVTEFKEVNDPVELEQICRAMDRLVLTIHRRGVNRRYPVEADRRPSGEE